MSRYTVADHLFDRLAELDVEHIFGVPGDFTLGLLDHVEANDRISWVGTANELGAGYAADGYARIRGMGVVCTTFGVGELSAINAVAGSYAEHVPVLHLVGCPSTAVQSARLPTHHSLGDGDFEHTLRLTAEVTVAQAMLGAADAVTEIDRVLAAIVSTGQPGYLSLPADVVELPVELAAAPLQVPRARSDPAALAGFTEAARTLIGQTSPVVLADIFVSRVHAETALHEVIVAGDLSYASLLWGRRVVDEGGAGFLGTYVGAASEPTVRDAVEGAHCLITAGVFFTDLISAGFSQRLDDTTRIDVLPHLAVVAGTTFRDVEMADALGALATLVATGSPRPVPDGNLAPALPIAPVSGRLSQLQLWDAVVDALQPGDLVLADQGTSFYGLGLHRLPHDALFIGQPLWAAIGFTLPALLGAAIAAPSRRPVLLIGDGAAQLTIQELGTILRHGIPAVIVVVNNDGYTVERAIHGPTQGYNDIAPWRWTVIPEALGARPDTSHAVRVETVEELRGALAEAAVHRDRFTLIEAVTDRLDVPPLLAAVAAAAAKANAG